ncbi:hypothetical protein Golomagni_06706 [Golovinomyces magnicellulatus]|nr:hypothetical protein Golomagni_06706 [Golovinomyces magnicellulatus]
MYLKSPRTGHDGDSFHYSWPLPFVPVVDVLTGKITHVDWCYTGDSADGMVHTWKQGWAQSNMEEREYMPHLQPNFQARPGLKPLIVQQPEGASFTVSGKNVEWQGWNFRISWTAREGLALHDLRFKGRSVFHRLSMSEMTVPYGDPRPPLHRKQAFDVGDASCGFTANSLGLGCDCLGAIHYFDGHLALPNGELLQQQKVVCMHEVDDGLGMKHTNYRTNNPYVVRRRTLVLQTIITVANYEYIFLWHFDQTGAISFEVRATGVLSVSPIDAGKTSPYGNVVSRAHLLRACRPAHRRRRQHGALRRQRAHAVQHGGRQAGEPARRGLHGAEDRTDARGRSGSGTHPEPHVQDHQPQQDQRHLAEADRIQDARACDAAAAATARLYFPRRVAPRDRPRDGILPLSIRVYLPLASLNLAGLEGDKVKLGMAVKEAADV